VKSHIFTWAQVLSVTTGRTVLLQIFTWFYNCTLTSKRLTVSLNKELPSLLDYTLKFFVKNKLLQTSTVVRCLEYSIHLGPTTTSSEPILEPWRWRWSRSLTRWVWLKTLDAAVNPRERYWTKWPWQLQTYMSVVMADQRVSTYPFLGAFENCGKATISFVTSVRLFAWNNSAHTGRIFMKFEILIFF